MVIATDEIINRRLKRIPTWAATQRLKNLQRTGIASEVTINQHERKDAESWAEIRIITAPEHKEAILSLISSLGL